MLGKKSEGEAGGDGERARGRLTAVVCIFWVSFNSINVPGWRQEGSSIIKLIEMRGWARNLKAIYRGTRLSSGEGGQEQEPQAGEDERRARWGTWGSCHVRCLFQRAPLWPQPRSCSRKGHEKGLLGTSTGGCDYSSLSKRWISCAQLREEFWV